VKGLEVLLDKGEVDRNVVLLIDDQHHASAAIQSIWWENVVGHNVAVIYMVIHYCLCVLFLDSKNLDKT
jgi:hypothetical protein